MIKVAINGFGRIGRLFLREVINDNNIEVIAINDLSDTKTLSHLLKYDSAQGISNLKISCDENNIFINDKKIQVFAKKDPMELPWKKLEIDLVVECSGKFTDRVGSQKHIDAGAKKVIISAPAKDKDIPTIVYNVNHQALTKSDNIISAASCTTNALAPICKIINDKYEIISGLMTTIHAYTADQRLQDASHKDLRRARAAAFSIVPTSTGAAKAIGLVIPELEGKMSGLAIRVPVITGSIIDLSLELKKQPTKEELNLFIVESINDSLGYTNDPIVSCDIIGNKHGGIFDPSLTTVLDINGKKSYKLFVWYDNESSYVAQMVRTIKWIESKLL